MSNHFKNLCEATKLPSPKVRNQTCFQNDMYPHGHIHASLTDKHQKFSCLGHRLVDLFWTNCTNPSSPNFRGLWIFQRNYKFKLSYYLEVKLNPTLAPVSSKAASRKQLFYSLSPFLNEGKNKVCPKQQNDCYEINCTWQMFNTLFLYVQSQVI